MKKKHRIVFSLAVGIANICLFGYIVYSRDSLAGAADLLIKECTSQTYPRACYDEKVSRLMDRMSMEDAFKTIQIIRERDTQYEYCHTGAHRIAEREVEKDPESWGNVLARCPSTENGCAFGCLHGAFQAYYRNQYIRKPGDLEKLMPALRQACDKNSSYIKTEADLATCYHGIGHVGVYITNADIPLSLSICDTLVADRYRHQCYEGVFMQLLNPTEQEDKDLVEGKAPKTKEDTALYCGQFDGEKQAVCWWSGWTMAIDDVRTGDGVVRFCSVAAEDGFRDYCFRNTYRVIARYLNFEKADVKVFCNSAFGHVGQCYAMTAAHIVYITPSLRGKAEDICFLAELAADRQECQRAIEEQILIIEKPLP